MRSTAFYLRSLGFAPSRQLARKTTHPSATNRGHGGFTLIELLVVIGIIALLIGILMPSLASVRKESRKTVCKAQLQQIGYAVRMYLNTNKGRYPQAPALPSINLLGHPPLTENLAPYIGNEQRVFQCPADETLFPTEGISYFYYTELGERKVTDTTFYKVYQDMTRVPIAWDADHFHGGSLPFNWLFIDGHVEHFLDAGKTQATPAAEGQ